VSEKTLAHATEGRASAVAENEQADAERGDGDDEAGRVVSDVKAFDEGLGAAIRPGLSDGDAEEETRRNHRLLRYATANAERNEEEDDDSEEEV